jgi:hypothetical protein
MAAKKKKKKKAPPNTIPCDICGYVPKKCLIRHHLDYGPPEVLINVCYGCHTWMHGNGKVFFHLIKRSAPINMAPFVFAKAVVQIYEERLILPAIRQAVVRQAEENARAYASKEDAPDSTTH